MKSVYDALDPIVNGSLTEKEKGTKYEAACVWYLRNDPFWSGYFSRVGTLEQALGWSDCPIHDSQDTGIDLVAQTETGGFWCAIQCKCYDASKDLPKGVCDSFFARAAFDDDIAELMIMTSAAKAGKHLEQQLEKSGAFFLDTQKMANSNLDWTPFVDGVPASERATYDLRPHQEEAVAKIEETFETNDRCKAIMACGTGKTLMSLRLAEEYLDPEGIGTKTVLFCAPSIALVGQSMREWMAQSRVRMSPLVVCSDSRASRLEDSVPMTLMDFEYPATTSAESLASAYAACAASNDDGLIVVFSTYQSIDVIHKAQQLGIPEFDLVICDEAHRTTGNALPGVSKAEASAFMKVHYNENVAAKKRLYMTATPRIYGETAKRKGAEEDYTIASMDDESIYGPTAYQIKFGEAVERGLLTDYKVVVLTVMEDAIGERIAAYDDEGVDAASLDPEDIGKIIGCWKGLVDHGEAAPKDATGLGDMLVVDDMDTLAIHAKPLRRAVGFCSTINASKTICEAFNKIVEGYAEDAAEEGYGLECELKHVDGNMRADVRTKNIAWLGEDVPEGKCRILTNARCLAEGIDVPNLDAVIFFNAKNSTVDVVQAVGRVMRRAEGKDYGYIILPIFVPAGMSPEEALDDSKVFANVWSILQALRSHDERIEARVNELNLLQEANKNKLADSGKNHEGWDGNGPSAKEREDAKAAEIASGVQMKLSLFPVERWEKAVKTQLVKKCGTRIYWDEWADDVARIAKRHIERIGELVRGDDDVRTHFDVFLKGLQDSLNPHVTADDAIEMVAQHIITVPVFDALFSDFKFADSNPVSIAINRFLSSLEGHNIGEASDADVLEGVYASVRRRAAVIQSDAARQQLIRDLYERFFKVAFKGTSDKMGVVYTPTEIIDYILRETDRVLRSEFGKSLADDGVHILDPFAGTGAFMAHLVESDLIPDEKLRRKYTREIHSNEILLLAYYIMTVNIEQAYHARMGGDYVPFDGAVLTDTFQMTEESNTLDDEVFYDNADRVRIQNALPIRVIVGNPPYSSGQKNADDANANDSYPTLDARLEATYVQASDASNKRQMYDSYIRAFRWATDRIGKQGIVCFVSNAGWLRGQAMAGIRRCFRKEVDDIYVFDLRGNQRTMGEESRKEGGKVFGQGSRTPVAVTMLVKKKNGDRTGRIHYHDVGDYKTREEKLALIREAAVDGDVSWATVEPDEHGDWFDKREKSFDLFAPAALGKLKAPAGIFQTYSLGIATGRDSWAWNYSASKVKGNMSGLIGRLDYEVDRYAREGSGVKPEDFVTYDPAAISWNRNQLDDVRRGRHATYGDLHVVTGMYRPFCKQSVYFCKQLTAMTYQQTRLFPLANGERAQGPTNKPMLFSKADLAATGEVKGKGAAMTYQQTPGRCLENLAILVTGNSSTFFSTYMTNLVPDLNCMKAGSQCFPLYWYEENEAAGGLFGNEVSDGYTRHDAITDQALEVFRKAYPHAFVGRFKKDGGEELTKLDIFFYVYGILHSPEYRSRFAANLKKELPRIPLAADFQAFSEAGRRLAELHVGYESVEPWASIVEDGDPANPGRTEKMTFGKCKKDDEHPKGQDMTVLHVAERMTLRGIPERAYEYVVNGRSAIGWLIDRYQVRKDKASGIVNDPNDYSDEPRYIVDLVERVVTVSMETLDIVAQLPALNEREQPADWPVEWKVM